MHLRKALETGTANIKLEALGATEAEVAVDENDAGGGEM